MADILYFSRNPNPRLGVAVARHLDAAVDYRFAAPFAPDQSERFRALNPTRLLPILVEGEKVLWEVDAIACRLAMRAGSDFWPLDDRLPELIRWISWAKANFMQACDIVHWERGTKQRYRFGPVDEAEVARGMEMFHRSAAQLDEYLTGRDFLLDALSYADFRMASVLPYNDVARLPLQDYPAIASWHDRLQALPAWADPFAGLEAPELPPVPVQPR